MATVTTTERADQSPSLQDYLGFASAFSNIQDRQTRLQDRQVKLAREAETNRLLKQWDGLEPGTEGFEDTIESYRQSDNYDARVEEAATLHLLNRSKAWVEYDTNLAQAEHQEGLARVGEARKVYLSGDEDTARSMLAEVNNTNPIIPWRVEFEGDGKTIHYFRKNDNEYMGSKPLTTDDMFKIAVQLSEPNSYVGKRVVQLGEIGKNNNEAFINADIFVDEANSPVGRGYIRHDKKSDEDILSFTYTDGTTVQGEEAQKIMSGLTQVGGQKFRESMGSGLAGLNTAKPDTKALKSYLGDRDSAIKTLLDQAALPEEPNKVAESLRVIDKRLRSLMDGQVPVDAGSFVDQIYNLYNQAYSLTEQNLTQKEEEGFFKRKGSDRGKERDKVFKANLDAVIKSFASQGKQQPSQSVVGTALQNLGKAGGAAQRAPLAEATTTPLSFEESLAGEKPLPPDLDELPKPPTVKLERSFGRPPTGKERTTLR